MQHIMCYFYLGRLLLETKLDFKKALEIANATEAAFKNAQELQSTT